MGTGQEIMSYLKKEFIKLLPKDRLYHLEKPIIALTGGVATGKSTVAEVLKNKGLKIIDADQLVKSIYATEEAHEFIKTNVPAALQNGAIHFPSLRELFFQNPKIKELVEKFIYARLPMAFQEESKKIKDQSFYVYDVPLLFERGLNTLVDLTILVYAPRETQLERLIKRDACDRKIAEKMLQNQLDIEIKKLKADLIIDNTGTIEEISKKINELLSRLLTD
jgi:dephospho-CoA kinase